MQPSESFTVVAKTLISVCLLFSYNTDWFIVGYLCASTHRLCFCKFDGTNGRIDQYASFRYIYTEDFDLLLLTLFYAYALCVCFLDVFMGKRFYVMEVVDTFTMTKHDVHLSELLVINLIRKLVWNIHTRLRTKKKYE